MERSELGMESSGILDNSDSPTQQYFFGTHKAADFPFRSVLWLNTPGGCEYKWDCDVRLVSSPAAKRFSLSLLAPSKGQCMGLR